MNENKRIDVTTLLVNDALEAAEGQGSRASLLLIDAAITIVLTRLDRAGAEEMGGMLAAYFMKQIEAVAAAGGAE